VPTIYAAIPDGRVLNLVAGGSWADTRDADTGTSANPSISNSTTAVGILGSAAGGGTYRVARAFFAFDTSAIISKVQSATISIYGANGAGSDCDIIGVKATKPDTSTDIAVEDFDAITGWTDGESANGNVTDYTSEVATWDSSGYNEITLNADALVDLEDSDTFAICFMEYDKDYLNSDPGTSHGLTFVGMHHQEYSGTSRDPKIDYTFATVSKINGIAMGDVNKINAIAKSSIADINDFDLP
jgi:hypothetical protein